MPTDSVSVSAEFQRFAAEQVQSGRYASANEVLHAAVVALKREESHEEAARQRLEQAIEDGFASGIAEGDVFARVRERAGLPPRER